MNRIESNRLVLLLGQGQQLGLMGVPWHVRRPLNVPFLSCFDLDIGISVLSCPREHHFSLLVFVYYFVIVLDQKYRRPWRAKDVRYQDV
jgi:hypothetical protein